MSESKSDALTNLATPLHRSGALRHRTPTTFNRFAVRRPTRPADAAPDCGTFCPSQPVPAACTAPGIASPVDRSRKHRAARTRHAAVAEDCLQQHRAPAPPAAHTASAAGCRSLRPKLGVRALRCAGSKARKYSRFGASRAAAGWRRWRASRCCAGGLTHGEPLRRGTSIGVRRSPMPSTKALLPADEERHVGAEPQRRAPAAARAASPAPRAGSARAASTAASELPPPMPAPHGHALVDRDVGAERACRWPPAARARRAGTGRRPAARRRGRGARSRPSSRRSKCSVSHQSISTNTDCSRW